MTKKPSGVYIGNPTQQEKTIRNLSIQFGEANSGIFIVSGPGRCGKNTAVTKALESLNLFSSKERHTPFEPIRPDVNAFDDSFDLTLETWRELYSQGKNTFATGEVDIHFINSLTAIRDFYEQAKKDGRDIRLIFNTLSRDHPAWQNDKLEASLRQQLAEIFPRDMHFFYLESDKSRIIDELWQLRQEGSQQYIDGIGSQLGFNTISMDWYELDEMRTRGEFEAHLMRLMGEGSHPHPKHR